LRIFHTQIVQLTQPYLVRNIETLEAFMLSTGEPGYQAATANERRRQVLRAIQRAASYGCPSVQDAAKVLLLMSVQGDHFDLLPRAQGGLFDHPRQIDAAALDAAVQQLLAPPKPAPGTAAAPLQR
jgi:hypothetical protein